MIKLTRFDGTNFVVNVDIIQYLESTPDTIITLNTGDKLMVKETVDQVIEKVIEFKRAVLHSPPVLEADEKTDVYE